MTRDEIISEAKSAGGMFAVIPAVVLRDQVIPMSGKMLYGILTWRSNEESRCWPTNQQLADELGLSKKRVSALLSLLEQQGHIETELILDPATGQVVRRYIYPTVKSSRGLQENEAPLPSDLGTPIPKNEDILSSDSGGPLPKNEEYKMNNKYKHKDIPPIVPQGGHEPDGGDKPKKAKRDVSTPKWKPERFAAFWDYYRTNIRGESRQAAVKAWDKLKPDDELIDTMARALSKQLASEARKSGDYMPYASTWLNGRRWEDTPPVDTTPPAQAAHEEVRKLGKLVV